MTDSRETYKILDLALRIGEILLSSGAGAADVTATMMGITQHYGLRNADIDVTFTLLRMSYQDDPDEVPVLLTRPDPSLLVLLPLLFLTGLTIAPSNSQRPSTFTGSNTPGSA